MTSKLKETKKSHLRVDTEVKERIEDLKVVLKLQFNYEVIDWLLLRGIESLDPQQQALLAARQKLREFQ